MNQMQAFVHSNEVLQSLWQKRIENVANRRNLSDHDAQCSCCEVLLSGSILHAPTAIYKHNWGNELNFPQNCINLLKKTVSFSSWLILPDVSPHCCGEFFCRKTGRISLRILQGMKKCSHHRLSHQLCDYCFQ